MYSIHSGFILLTVYLLSGCSFYAGLGYHNNDTDYQFRQSSTVTTFGSDLELTEKLPLHDDLGVFFYWEHKSLPTVKDGMGLNELGVRARYKLGN